MSSTATKRPLGKGITIKPKLSYTRVIPGAAIHHFIKPFEHHTSSESVLEGKFYHEFWSKLSSKVPLQIAPAVIIVLGLVINIATTVPIIQYSNYATLSVPEWTVILAILGSVASVNIYAVARRHKLKVQNTQLEEFVELFAESISTYLGVWVFSAVFELGDNYGWIIAFYVFAMFAQVTKHYATYATDIYVYSKYDYLEIHTYLMITYLLVLVLTIEPFRYMETFMQMEIRHCILYFYLILYIGLLIRYIFIVIGARTPFDDFYTYPRREQKERYVPYFYIYFWYKLCRYAYETELYYPTNPLLFIAFFSVVLAKLAFKLKVIQMGKLNSDKVSWCLLSPLAMVLVPQYLTHITPYQALVGCLIVSTSDLLFYAVRLLLDIRDLQDINIFSIKYPVGHEKNKGGDRGYHMNVVTYREVRRKVEQEKLAKQS